MKTDGIGSEPPSLSVVIRAHNRTKFVERAVRSVLSQNLHCSKAEIVVVKAFTDPFLEGLLKTLGAKLVHVTEGGQCQHLLAGVENSSGEIIAFLDDDDEFLPGKLCAVVEAFGKNSELIYYHNSQITVDEDGNPRKEYRAAWKKPVEESGRMVFRSPFSLGDLNMFLRTEPQFNMSSIAVRRTLIEQNVEAYKRGLRQDDVLTFVCALCSRGELMLDSRRLTLYRLHKGNFSARQSNTTAQYIKENLEFLKNVVPSTVAIREYARRYGSNAAKRYISYYYYEHWLTEELLARQQSALTVLLNLLSYVSQLYPSTFLHQLKKTGLTVLNLVYPDMALSLYVTGKFSRRTRSTLGDTVAKRTQALT
ncbi:MAG: glycosyltransferase family 2 protein [Thermoprotei archaeon]